MRSISIASLLVASGILSIIGGLRAADAELLVLKSTIRSKGVAGKLDHLAVDVKGERLFLANKPNNTLDIIDLKSGKLVKQIAEQGKVSGVAYAADLDRIYVGNGAGTCNCFEGKEYK
jgi:DNA-binding beta-propeller fold protein YncE